MLGFPLFAQPANDDCSNAIVLTAAANSTCNPVSASNAGVQSIDYDGCREISKRNVWFRFTALSSTQVVRVSYGTMQNGIVDIYGNTCGSLSSIEACNSPVAEAINETVATGLVVGQEYFVAVSTREESEEGSFDICIYTPTAPGNDNCINAISLTVNPSNVPVQTTNGTTLFATQSQVGCSGEADDDVWYSFVATQTSHRIHISYTNSFFTLEAFSGSCGSLVSIACASPSGNYKTVGLTALVPGQTYFVRVYSNGSSASEQGSFSIGISSSPVNDECLNAATVVPSLPGNDACANPVVGSTFDATQSGTDCFGGNATSNDTWFRFTAVQAVQKIKVFGFGSNTIRFQVLGGNCGSLVSLYCQTPVFLNDTAYTSVGGLTTGQTYFVRVYSGNSGGVEGLFNICVSSPAFPVNDECANAIELIPSADSAVNFTNGSSVGATNAGMSVSCNPLGNEVWYRFTATASQHVLKTLNSSNNSTLFMEWYSGTCGALVHQRCSNGPDSLFGLGGLTIGQTYYLRVYTGSAFMGDDFRIALFTPLALPNDECSGAIDIVPASNANCEEISGTNLGATQSVNDNCDGNALIGAIRDVWYKFTASSTSHRIRLIRGTGAFLRYKLYNGSCGTFTEIACSPQNTASTIGTGIEQRFNGLTIGSTYYIRVFNTGLEEPGTFDLCVKTVVVPANNECTTATILLPQQSIQFGNYTVGNTTDATQSAQATACASGNDDDVWFQFTATQANMQVMLQNGGIGATNIAVYSGNCAALTLVKCRTGNVRDNLVPLTGLTVGTTYLIRVYSTSNGASQGTFSIMVTTDYNPPANDDCINAIVLVPSSDNNLNNLRGTTIDAGASGNTVCVNGNEVWYRFTAAAASHRINVEGLVNTPQLTLFSGSCAALTQVPATCVAGNLQVSVTANGLTIGNSYFVKVASNSTAAFQQSYFNIAITTPQVPLNNECAGAILLPVLNDESVESLQQYSTNLATFNNNFNCSVLANDVWFRFVAPSTPVTVELDALNTNASIEVLTGNCGALVNVACNGTSTSNLNNIINLNGLMAGNTYYVRVGSNSFSIPLEFRLKVFKNPSVKFNSSIDSTCMVNNLVFNPGFETDFQVQPSFVFGVNPGAELIYGWRLPTRGTADFFNSLSSNGSAVEVPANLCFGNQSPRNGYGYAGFYGYVSSSSNTREYLEGMLTSPMTVGKKYLVSMYVSLADFSTIAIDNIGIALRSSATREISFANLPYTPAVVSPDNQFIADKKLWVNISAIVTADQPYQYLVIGNFKNNSATDTLRLTDTSAALSGGTFSGCATNFHTAYYFVDDVVVAEINENAGPLCRLSSVPLKLMSFTGKKSGDQSLLQWRTSEERNTSHFDIERSSGGNNFVTIGTVPSINRPGINDYRYTDAAPLRQINYYRLKQVDLDGSVTYSPIVKLDFGNTASSIVFNNPVGSQLILNIPATWLGADISIFSVDGRIVHRQKANQSVLGISCNSWAGGVYVIRAEKGERRESWKVVKR